MALAVVAAGLWLLLRPPTVEVPPPSTTLVDVTVVNPGRERRQVRSLHVRGGRIAWLGDIGIAPRADVPDPERRDEADPARYAGSYVLPGLIDMHVHLPPATPLGDLELASLLFLLHGVTTVRDTGSVDGTVLEARRAIRLGEFPGPRIFTCGAILDGEPPFGPEARVVRDASEASAAVDELAAAGVDCIKVHDRLSPEALRAVREAAARHRLPVIGHVPAQVPFDEAGLADVQHLTGIVAQGELSAERERAIVAASAAHGIAHTPTLVFLERAARLGDRSLLADPTVRFLPRYYPDVLWRRASDARLHGLAADDPESARERPQVAKRLVKAMHDAGVEIHVGTDAMSPFVVPGASLHEEMWALVDAGLTPEQVWIAATRTAGKALGQPTLGTIAVGAAADLLVFREDPTQNLSALQTLEAVVAAGRLYSRAELQEALGRWQRRFENPLYEAITLRLAAWLVPRR